MGAFVELRGHLGGFPGGTAEGDEDLGKLGKVHEKSVVLGSRFDYENEDDEVDFTSPNRSGRR